MAAQDPTGATNMATITIQGYERECNCDHCGRPLKLGVQVSTYGVIGADCFRKLIKPNRTRYNGNGIPSADWVKQLAIIASKGDAYARDRYGFCGNWKEYELR